MKKYILIPTSLIVTTLLIFTACESNTRKSEKNEGGVIIGNITDGNKATAELTISLDDATGLMQDHNRLTQEIFIYTYTRAWIEIIQTGENKFNYYLGVEASLKSKNNEMVYSCYSIYSELTSNNNELFFYPDAVQQSCKGKCCNNCKLVMFDNNNLGCECESSSDEPDCKDNGKCKLSISRVMDKEQKKNDLI